MTYPTSLFPDLLSLDLTFHPLPWSATLDTRAAQGLRLIAFMGHGAVYLGTPISGIHRLQGIDAF